MINYHFIGLYKNNLLQSKVQLLSVFLFSLTAVRLFSLSYQSVNNRENLKILMQIFRQKFLVSKVISAFLNHLKPKNFNRRPNIVANIERPSFSKFLDPSLADRCLL